MLQYFIYYSNKLSHFTIFLYFQLFAVWIAAQMVSVNLANAAVILAGLEIFAINCLVMPDVLNMANVKMAHAFVHKAGMADIVHCVSIETTTENKSTLLRKKKKENH